MMKPTYKLPNVNMGKPHRNLWEPTKMLEIMSEKLTRDTDSMKFSLKICIEFISYRNKQHKEKILEFNKNKW